METLKLQRMNGGVGETSYAHNSSLQGKVLSNTEHIRKAAIRKMYQRYCSIADKCIRIADLGCSSGPNALVIVREIIVEVDAIRCDDVFPDLQIMLNDLPSNDFNTIFRSLPVFLTQIGKAKHNCFFNGVPGSFYNRLFERESLHFVHSSYSLHWLSQVPKNLEAMNKGELWLSNRSPKSVVEAYSQQFRADFSRFLRFRSEEMVRGGCMVFTLLGRENDVEFSKKDATYSWNLLSLAISQMTLEENLVDVREKLDSFNIPAYVPSELEIRREVEKQGLFVIDCMERSEVGWESAVPRDMDEEGYIGMLGSMRAMAEPLLSSAFGAHLMDPIFDRYAHILRHAMSTETCVYLNLTLSLSKT